MRRTRSHYETSQQSFPSLLSLCRSLLGSFFCPSFNHLLILVMFFLALL
jgi:hypothetical protein